MKLIEWKVVTGCERLTPGCDNCPTYWEAQREGFDYTPAIQPVYLNDPLRNHEASVYLVASGSDLFHESVPLEFIQVVFHKIMEAGQHQFEIVTKRAERLEMLGPYLPWPDNLITGVAVEESRYKWRIDCLRNIPGRKFVSFGPMTGRIGEVDLTGIEGAGVVVEDWGPAPRSVEPEWIEEINMQCEEQGVLLATNKWVVGEEV